MNVWLHKMLSYLLRVVYKYTLLLPSLPGDKANLDTLRNFPGRKGRHTFNIIQRISTNYFAFGIALLKGETGTKISEIIMKERGAATAINTEVLNLWLGGEGIADTTWGGLIRVLRSPCRLNALAEEIEEAVGK